MADPVVLIQQGNDEVIEAVAAFAQREAGWRLIAFSDRSLPGMLQRFPEALGAIACSKQRRVGHLLTDAGLPWLNLRHPEGGRPLVASDYRAIGRLAAEHLGNIGAATLAVQGNADNALARGFMAAARQTVLLAPSGRAFANWLAGLDGSVALCASSDGAAVDAINAARDLGRRVPQDLAICGINNNRAQVLCAAIPLSSIDLDMPAMATTAARLLHAHLRRKRDIPALTLVPPKSFVHRRSTDVRHGPRNEVDLAMAFMDEHFAEGIGIDDVILHCDCSRSKLERHFRDRLGTSPGRWLQERRLQEARRLIENGHFDCVEVAVHCGFTSLSYLSRAFKRRFGCPPSRWRGTTDGAPASVGRCSAT